MTWEICFIDPIWHKGLSSIEMVEEIKLTYALHNCNLKIFPKYRNKLTPHYHRKLLLKWECHLIKIAPVDLYTLVQDLRSTEN